MRPIPPSGIHQTSSDSGGLSSGSNYSTNAPTPSQQRTANEWAGASWSYLLVTTNSQTPFGAPGRMVPDGCKVKIRAHNGQPAGNVSVVRVSTSRADVLTLGVPLAPLDEIEFPVTNTGQIWISALQMGDGVVISIVPSY